jgi:hypothetical protein
MPVDTWPLEKTYIQISHLPRNISQAETAANIASNDTVAMTAPQFAMSLTQQCQTPAIPNLKTPNHLRQTWPQVLWLLCLPRKTNL